ncbi:uncharacterized protein UTRI_02278 [Ustilago trichophora]|uniref:Uncharacterized protein n=1 Tax=Ustilago trichophora TaxID=86804 RepID=A0A5C3E5L5_9BASI|nr:uncharacterized protein UTRI_02278 [Ustilago trichophora]
MSMVKVGHPCDSVTEAVPRMKARATCFSSIMSLTFDSRHGQISYHGAKARGAQEEAHYILRSGSNGKLATLAGTNIEQCTWAASRRRSACKPNHADLQGAIADGSFHPAIEACLHLINGDLYSAHFLVRKAQGGSRYLDWLHAVLHKLEGDFRNAKMWYTDLGNNNAGALDANAMVQYRKARQAKLASSADFTHSDLVFLSSLASKATGSAAATPEPMRREVERHHSSTTLSEGKIKNSESAFSLEELGFVCDTCLTTMARGILCGA